MTDVNVTDSELKIIADMVYETSGIIFKDSNLSVLISRLSSKLKEKKIGSADYIGLLKSDKKELMSFIDFITTNFTSFFRNPRHFEMLLEEVLPEVVKRNEAVKKVRIWSAGCSTGEEPYTLAMILSIYFEKNGLYAKDWDFEIIGSDISLESLFIAKEGKFPPKSVEKINKDLMERFFVPLEDGFVIKDELKKRIRFDYHNLIYDNGLRDLDIAFCRNVLIYFDTDIQKRVVANIELSMKPEGFLFIGHSESLIGLYEGFKPVNLNKGIVYVRQ